PNQLTKTIFPYTTLFRSVKNWILKEFDAAGIWAEEGPDIAVNAHASDPHYGPTAESAAPIREGDLLLMDVWGKKKTPGSVYYDRSEEHTSELQSRFDIVC